MTTNRYEKLLHIIGLSQVGAARFLDIDERQSRRFIAGERELAAMGRMLLEAMAAARRLKATELRELLTDPNKLRRLAKLDPVDGLNRGSGNPDWMKE
jgi:hypothetical protein